MTIQVVINGKQHKYPAVKLDGKIYFVQSETYSRLYNEAIITERYTPAGEIDRQVVQTNKHRWEFTVMVPTNEADLSVTGTLDSSIGRLSDLHASSYKTGTSSLLQFYDIESYEDFSGDPSHLVYLGLDREAPVNNDPSRWQVPVRLWGYNNS